MARKKNKTTPINTFDAPPEQAPVEESGWYTGKIPCPECGLPREPSYAERSPCIACGTVGLAPLVTAQEPADIAGWFTSLEADTEE